MRKDKKGHLSKQYPPPHIQNTLASYNINPEHWTESIQNFDQGFFTAVGQIKAMIENALNNGKQWCEGKTSDLKLYQSSSAKKDSISAHSKQQLCMA
ncbi:MAG: hypothetical protein ACWA5R_10185 [bacterium]